MFVQFEVGRDGNPIARINRKVSFPPRGSQVQIGEWWEVEIEREEEKVNFLKLIGNFSAKTEIVAEVEYGHRHFTDPNSQRRVCPDAYNVHCSYILSGILSSIDQQIHVESGQVWRFEIDHTTQSLIPVERIETDRDRMIAHGERILATLKSLVPTYVADVLFVLDGKIYGIYSTFHLDASTVTVDDCQKIVNAHLQEWEKTIPEMKAYYAAQPAYSGPDDGGLTYCHEFE
jgi:hypothetical protein